MGGGIPEREGCARVAVAWLPDRPGIHQIARARQQVQAEAAAFIVVQGQARQRAVGRKGEEGGAVRVAEEGQGGILRCKGRAGIGLIANAPPAARLVKGRMHEGRALRLCYQRKRGEPVERLRTQQAARALHHAVYERHGAEEMLVPQGLLMVAAHGGAEGQGAQQLHALLWVGMKTHRISQQRKGVSRAPELLHIRQNRRQSLAVRVHV